MNYRQPTQRMVSFLAISALALGLAACGKKDEEQTVGQKLDAAVAKTEQAAADAQRKAEQVAEDAQRKTEQAMETTSAKVEDGAAKAEAALKDAGDAAKEAAGKALGVADDAAITAQVAAGLAKDPELSALKINVDTKGGVVTLSGPAPTAQAKERATGIAKGVKGVGGVNNQLNVQAG